MKNYFNNLNFRQKLIELQSCRLMCKNEFLEEVSVLKNKKIVIVGCGSQGLNQGLNLRDSGLLVSFAFRETSILNKSQSWKNAIQKKFTVGTYKALIPDADLVINLTPDKQHSSVIKKITPLMKTGSFLGYSHGFHIVEMTENIRNDITIIMVAPKCPGTEVRKEFTRGFGVPALIAVHKVNNYSDQGLNIAKAWAVGIGAHRAGVLESSFVAEVKSDLMGEQTILCGMLQSCSLVCYDHLISKGYCSEYSVTLIQMGWERLSESMKLGGITLLFNRLSNSSKKRANDLSLQIKNILRPLFRLHMDNIISGNFSKNMISDWNNNDKNLYLWREEIKNSEFEKSIVNDYPEISDQEYFDKCTLMIAMLKAGVELSFEIMIETGIKPESAYYESLHELPLIANTISKKRLYQMNIVISDTAEFGSYLFSKKAIPILKRFIETINSSDLGELVPEISLSNSDILEINKEISNHKIEHVGKKLRSYMVKMKPIC